MPDQETIVEIQGRKLKLTRLDKVMYPAVHFTKAEVIDYYLRVSPFILPHLKDRPLTLKRFPNGVKGEAYWDKDVPSFAPSWVRTFPVPRHAGGPDINYLLINDTATLVWAANAAALELHPFLHKAPAITVPTWIVLDLDPGEGADILTCAEVAFLIKKTMDRLGLQLFPKVSGSKGIQLYIPLNTDVTYDVTQPFARAVAQWIEKERPDIAVSEMPKIKRTGKVFIDWSQNSDYKTTAGVYSLRAKQDRPLVSMPVQWEELRSALKRKKADGLAFEPKTALDRLEKIGDLFAPVLTLKQTLPPEFTDAMGPPAKTRTTVRKAGGSASQAALPRRSAQGGRRRFVIQKHDASRLHYDLRLEMNGALKSWALPKGMPYELGVRRLASATEDHPLEYLSFEGVIPKGQYGGGTVMVWDIGTYEIIDGSYYQGRLHVSFAGKKLKGEWLLRKDPSKGPNAWMLEKAGASMRAIPAEKEDESAVTGRTMAQIAADRDAVWQSNRTPVAETTGAAAQIDVDLESLPKARSHFIPPMQAKLVASLPEGEQWEYEAKFDGYRALVLKSGEITILSRNNHDLTNEFREIAAGFADLEEESVVDGEIVGLDEKGAPAFNVLQNRKSHRGAIQFYAFDLLTYRGRDLLSLPLAKRRALLSAALKKTRDPVKFSASLSAETRALVHAARKLGLEGIVAKRLDSRYEPGKRSGAWQKFKLNQTQELVIGGYIPAPKRHFDALLAGYYEGDRLMFAGKIRNGFKDPGSKERVFARFKGLGTDKCPFANLPEPANARRGMALTAEAMKLCCWLKPTLVAEVGIREWTTEGHLRHATFLGLRDDKDPHEVVREAA